MQLSFSLQPSVNKWQNMWQLHFECGFSRLRIFALTEGPRPQQPLLIAADLYSSYFSLDIHQKKSLKDFIQNFYSWAQVISGPEYVAVNWLPVEIKTHFLQGNCIFVLRKLNDVLSINTNKSMCFFLLKSILILMFEHEEQCIEQYQLCVCWILLLLHLWDFTNN